MREFLLLFAIYLPNFPMRCTCKDHNNCQYCYGNFNCNVNGYSASNKWIQVEKKSKHIETWACNVFSNYSSCLSHTKARCHITSYRIVSHSNVTQILLIWFNLKSTLAYQYHMFHIKIISHRIEHILCTFHSIYYSKFQIKICVCVC